ncbi:DNA primase [compost metagenome]
MILRDQEVKALLYDIGLEKIKSGAGDKGKNYRFCCPFHGERNPSAGVVVSHTGVYGQCFTCKETFTLPKLVSQCMDYSIMEAVEFLEERFNVSFRGFSVEEKTLRRYDDAFEEESRKPKRRELPYYKLAPFRSGKETHKYYLDRGFDMNDVRVNMIGWDRVKKRITIPIFHADGVLAGFSGRAVLNEKLPGGRMNPRYEKVYGKQPKYLLYDHLPISELLYGSHDFFSTDKTAIICEGILDRQWYRKMGFRNCLSSIIAKIAKGGDNYSKQIEILHKLGVERIIFAQDADQAGSDGKERFYELAKDDFVCYDSKYPDGWKDILGDPEAGIPPMTRKQIQTMLDGKWLYGRKRRELPRL